MRPERTVYVDHGRARKPYDPERRELARNSGTLEMVFAQDLLAALAPKYLACNEGGAERYLDTVRHGYALAGVPDRLQISEYPKYADVTNRTHPEALPKYRLSEEAYFEHCYVDAADHSFREEPSIRFLKKCFDE